MRYLALHFQKESQAPPRGWKGHRFTSSRGYFPDGVAAARERARESLRVSRAVHWANGVAEALWQDRGVVLVGDELDDLVEQHLGRARGTSWSVRKVRSESQDVDRKRSEAAREPFRRVHNVSGSGS